MSIWKQNNETLLDNAACASQHRPLLDNDVIREAVESNCIEPLRLRITELEGLLEWSMDQFMDLQSLCRVVDDNSTIMNASLTKIREILRGRGQREE